MAPAPPAARCSNQPARPTAVLATAALTLSACSTGPAASTSDASASSSSTAQFPVTIKHVFGETTIKEQPTGVATVSWANDDVAIALGVVPVGVPRNDWGGNEQGSTPWKDAALRELGAGFGTERPRPSSTRRTASTSTRSPSSPRRHPGLVLRPDRRGLQDPQPDRPGGGLPRSSRREPRGRIHLHHRPGPGRTRRPSKLVSDTEPPSRTRSPSTRRSPARASSRQPRARMAEGVNVYTTNDNRPRFLSPDRDEARFRGGGQLDRLQVILHPGSAEKVNQLDSTSWSPGFRTAATTDAIKADPFLASSRPQQRRPRAILQDPTLSTSASSPLSGRGHSTTFLRTCQRSGRSEVSTVP